MSAFLLEPLGRRLRVGLVGGGADSVIGETHRIALRIDGLYDLVAGAMSIDPDIAVSSARSEMLDADRTYLDFAEMADKEAARRDGIDMVVVATPPQTHLAVAQTFLRRGIHVACEKPMAATVQEAGQLAREVAASGRMFLLTHCYTGYPMVRHARELIRSGALGQVRLVEAEFASGDPGVAREPEDPSERHWRFRASSMGTGAILGEVGSHAHNICEFLLGERVARVSARLSTIASRREVYDNAYLTVEYTGGALGRLWSSYVAVGNEHGLSFRVFGDEAAISWRQEQPETLHHTPLGGPTAVLTRSMDGLSDASLAATRFRPGHPEGYALAFANLYRDFAAAIVTGHADEALPSVADGVSTMRLIEAAQRSNEAGGEYQVSDGNELTAAQVE